MSEAAGTDLSGDGAPEIVSLEYAGSSVKLGEPDPKRRLVLVLVESRLLQHPRFPQPGTRPPTLLSRLNRLVADIRRDGDDCRLVSADLYQGAVQKDGRVLLALRRFLQQARDRVGLTSVVMIGRFPEAQILRRWPWAPAFEKTIAGVATNGRRYLAVDPELVAGSADIVLADLTGHWEDVYRPSVHHPRPLPAAHRGQHQQRRLVAVERRDQRQRRRTSTGNDHHRCVLPRRGASWTGT